jgi:Ca-activated chloride channel family protein
MTAWHFLRPAWFLALLPLAALLWWWLRPARRAGAWQQVVDPQLLPHLLLDSRGVQRRWPLWLAGLLGLLSIVALAGPVFEKLPQPVFRAQSALVIVLDLSRSMDAADLKPSRLTRARLKVRDILQRRREGQTGLVVYAGAPFVVSPLTEDTATIAAQLDAMETDLMPARGSRADLALQKAATLLTQAGVAKGEILLITDGLADDSPAESVAAELRSHGHRVSVLGVGTADGAPIPRGDGQFIKDGQGNIVISRLTPSRLAALAAAGGGGYRAMRTDDQDIAALLQDAQVNPLDVEKTATDLHTDLWREEGPWLLLLVIPLAALAFRRGVLAAVLLLVLLPQPKPAMAGDWDDLWSNADQRAAKALAAGDAATAAKTFADRRWRAAAQYRAGQYQQSAKTLEGLDDAESLYNRGNALAKAGDVQGAMSAYDAALKKDPDNADARYNRDLLRRQQQKQQQSGNKNDKGDNKGKHKQGDQDSKGDKQAGDKSQGDKQDGQDKQAQQQDGQKGEQQDSAGGQKGDSQDQQDAAKSSQNASKDAAKQQKEKEKQAKSASRQDAKDAKDGQDKAQQASPSDDMSKTEAQQATEQWLRRIPDDPGGLWRRKFRYQYGGQGDKRQDEGDQAW